MTAKKYAKPTTDALEILDRLLYAERPDRRAAMEEAQQESDVAEEVYNMRKAARLTQKELARRVGTSPSVISRLEDADYGKHSLRMLDRVAAALGRTVRVNFPEIAPSQNRWHARVPGTGAQADPLSSWQQPAGASSDLPEKTRAGSGDLSLAA